MRVIFLSKPVTIILCFILWGIIQAGTVLICILIPDRCFDPDAYFYRLHKFERGGEIYEKVFKVRSWKGLLPDGGAVWRKKGYQKKNLKDLSTENLTRYLTESARGEMTHWLAMSFFWVFGFFTPFYVLFMMIAYALVLNLPCIIAQRYNRPRIRRILMKKRGKSSDTVL
ncbi:hypothetical protein [Proteiniclasticum sp.]|uniref:glycosyl-4,4'-diaponeurosporenoate acyltransferase CrtO family protein n=1 Tax=Proteiniclasticum sp. TaxID=2053595 RepID=UPI00289756A1|nr:hypothetical protein [Proteiniclasticum sp.]